MDSNNDEQSRERMRNRHAGILIQVGRTRAASSQMIRHLDLMRREVDDRLGRGKILVQRQR